MLQQIQKLNLEEIVNELRAKGYSLRESSEELKKRGYDVSHMSIKRYFESNNQAVTEVINKKQELKEKLAEQKLNIIEEILSLLSMSKQKLEEVENNHSLFLAYSKDIRANLELVAKLTGELDSGSRVSIQQNFIEDYERMPAEQAKLFLTKLVDKYGLESLIEKIDISYLIAKQIDKMEEAGYNMIKLVSDDSKDMIKSLDKEGKIQILKNRCI